MPFHFPKLETSKDLQALLKFLKNRGQFGATSYEIFKECGMLNPGREISALRKNGIRIRCEHDYTTEQGKRIYRYRYEESLEIAETAATAPAETLASLSPVQPNVLEKEVSQRIQQRLF